MDDEIDSSPRDLDYLRDHINLAQDNIDNLDRLIHSHRLLSTQIPLEDLVSERSLLVDERDTWLLLLHLQESEILNLNTIDISSSSVSEFFDHTRLVHRLVGENSIVLRSLAVIRWLEQIFSAKSEYPTLGDVTFRRTMSQILTGKDTTSKLVKRLDPDCVTRENGKTIDPEDEQEESVLFVTIWLCLRGGNLPEAVDICMQFGEPWRAASLDGGSLLTDSMNSSDITSYSGNPNRLQWKQCCRQLASRTSSSWERAVYGLLGGSLSDILPVCETRDDYLWAFFRKYADDQVDKMLYTSLNINVSLDLLSQPDERCLDINTIFSEVDKIFQNESVYPYKIVQRYMINEEYNKAIQYLAEYCNQKIDGTFVCPSPIVKFAIELYNYLNPLISDIKNDIHEIYTSMKELLSNENDK